MIKLVADIERLLIGLIAAALLFSGSVFAEDVDKVGEDGNQIEEGIEITDGMGFIDDISFDEGWVYIDDTKYLFADDVELISHDNGNDYESVFVVGVRVIWKVQGEETLLVMDYYPVDSTEEVADLDDEEDDSQTASSSSSSGGDITLGKDGVYRN